jgi:hypothetical protein
MFRYPSSWARGLFLYHVFLIVFYPLHEIWKPIFGFLYRLALVGAGDVAVIDKPVEYLPAQPAHLRQFARELFADGRVLGELYRL